MSSAKKSFLALVSWVPIALVSAAACGGSALENGNSSGGSNSLAGTSSVAGGGSTAGSGNSAGASQTVGGQNSGQAGSAAGGAIGPGGSGNAGASSGGAASSGGNAGFDVTACTSNQQCEVVPASCCSCGILGPATNFTAINSAYRGQFNERCATVD